jgi:predicted RNA-binding Zn ribbon-like protein
VTTCFHWSGDRVALDFCNTGAGTLELLETPQHLLSWLAEAGLGAPGRSSSTELDEARRLRDGLRGALASGDTEAVARLVDGWLEPAPMRVVVDHATLAVRPVATEPSCRCALVPVALDALSIAREHPDRVRECAAERCPALFLDLSRNRSRRWCSMGLCGARHKSRAYYRRHREAPGAPDRP